MKEGVSVRALVDSGCSQTIISSKFVRNDSFVPSGGRVMAVDGSLLGCGEVSMDVVVDQHALTIPCLVMEKLISEFDMVLGMDAIKRLGGMRLNGEDGGVQFGSVACVSADGQRLR